MVIYAGTHVCMEINLAVASFGYDSLTDFRCCAGFLLAVSLRQKAKTFKRTY